MFSPFHNAGDDYFLVRVLALSPPTLLPPPPPLSVTPCVSPVHTGQRYTERLVERIGRVCDGRQLGGWRSDHRRQKSQVFFRPWPCSGVCGILRLKGRSQVCATGGAHRSSSRRWFGKQCKGAGQLDVHDLEERLHTAVQLRADATQGACGCCLGRVILCTLQERHSVPILSIFMSTNTHL